MDLLEKLRSGMSITSADCITPEEISHLRTVWTTGIPTKEYREYMKREKENPHGV